MLAHIALVRHRRLTIASAAAAVLLVTLIGYAPARQVFAEFLNIFRVRQFTAVSVDPERAEVLRQLHAAVITQFRGAPIFEREPGAPRPVSSAEEASSITGFDVRVPRELPAGMQAAAFEVASGPAVRVDVDPEQVKAQLEAVGLGGIALPPLPAGTVRVDVPWVVRQEYKAPADARERVPMLRVVQAASPEVTLPPGADPAALGEALLLLYGLPAEEARRLASTIDWTGTLVLPMPEGLGQFQEVRVGDARGLLLEPKPGAGSRRSAMVIWERDGILYAVAKEQMTNSELLRIAESLGR
jgi:hypothetical protein